MSPLGTCSLLLLLLSLLCRGQPSRLLRQMEVERIRQQILKEIVGPRLSDSAAPRPPQAALDLMLRVSAEREEPQTQLMILPTEGAEACEEVTSRPCVRFEYNVSRGASPRWMISRSGLPAPDNLTAWASCRDAGILLEREDDGEDYLVYGFPEGERRTVRDLCHLEIAGVFPSDSPPLLTTVRQSTGRSVREAPSSSSGGCGVIPFRISFREIGMDRWVVHPPSFDARFCEGTCSGVRGHHEYLMGLLLGEEGAGRCWATCCRPSAYESIHLIHREEDNTFAHRLMANMIVQDCACS